MTATPFLDVLKQAASDAETAEAVFRRDRYRACIETAARSACISTSSASQGFGM